MKTYPWRVLSVLGLVMCVMTAGMRAGELNGGIAVLTDDLRAGIEKALPQVNRRMPMQGGVLIPVGFVQSADANAAAWQEMPVVLPNAQAETNLQVRVMEDLRRAIQEKLDHNTALGVVVFYEQAGHIELFVRDAAGIEHTFSVTRPAGTTTKSNLKLEDFKLREELESGLPPGVGEPKPVGLPVLKAAGVA